MSSAARLVSLLATADSRSPMIWLGLYDSAFAALARTDAIKLEGFGPGRDDPVHPTSTRHWRAQDRSGTTKRLRWCRHERLPRARHSCEGGFAELRTRWDIGSDGDPSPRGRGPTAAASLTSRRENGAKRTDALGRATVSRSPLRRASVTLQPLPEHDELGVDPRLHRPIGRLDTCGRPRECFQQSDAVPHRLGPVRGTQPGEPRAGSPGRSYTVLFTFCSLGVRLATKEEDS